MLRVHPTVMALGLGWHVQLADLSIRATIAHSAEATRREINQLAAVARIEIGHNIKVTFGRQS